MKKFLNIFLLFCLPILIVGGAMEFLLRYIPNEYQVKANYLKTHHESIKTLLVGSSYVLYGINPDELTDKAINFGNVSQTIDIDYNIVNQYLNHLEALETVVLRLSYTTLFEQLKAGNESWRIKNYVIYTDVNLESKLKHHSEVLSVKLKYNLQRIYDYYILNQSPEFVNTAGWGSNKGQDSAENKEELSIPIAKKHTIKDDEFYNENFRILEGLIETCKEKDVKVILVTMPVYDGYLKRLDREQLDKTISAGMYMEYKNNNCTYLNFLEDKCFGKQDFIDVDHLNDEGAKKFSKLLDSILLQ